jgi:histone acetyltransferase (RNA polymerase elongator complex component)
MSMRSQACTIDSRRKAIIPVFLPGVGCPQRCIFCNQEIVTDMSRILPSQQLSQYIAMCLGNLRLENYSGVEVAFYGGSFTALPLDRQREYLAALKPFRERHEVGSLRVSTRPDFLDAERVSLLKAHGVRVIEIGAQSMDDEVLGRARRGYTAHTVRDAAHLVGESGFEMAIHLMIGLPGDTVAKALWSGGEVIKLKPHFVRIHPTLVLRDTELARMYEAGEYVPWSSDEIIETAKNLLRRFESAGIRVARIGLQPSAGLLEPSNIIAGFNHPALKEVCESLLFFEQMKNLLQSSSHRVTFLVNPRDMSKALGHRKENLKKLRRLFTDKTIFFHAEGGVSRGKVMLASESGPAGDN